MLCKFDCMVIYQTRTGDSAEQYLTVEATDSESAAIEAEQRVLSDPKLDASTIEYSDAVHL